MRFKLTAAGTQARDLSVSTKLATLTADEKVFDCCRDTELEDGGITIEGVAVVGICFMPGFAGRPDPHGIARLSVREWRIRNSDRLNRDGLRVLVLFDNGKNGKPHSERLPYA